MTIYRDAIRTFEGHTEAFVIGQRESVIAYVGEGLARVRLGLPQDFWGKPIVGGAAVANDPDVKSGKAVGVFHLDESGYCEGRWEMYYLDDLEHEIARKLSWMDEGADRRLASSMGMPLEYVM